MCHQQAVKRLAFQFPFCIWANVYEKVKVQLKISRNYVSINVQPVKNSRKSFCPKSVMLIEEWKRRRRRWLRTTRTTNEFGQVTKESRIVFYLNLKASKASNWIFNECIQFDSIPLMCTALCGTEITQKLSKVLKRQEKGKEKWISIEHCDCNTYKWNTVVEYGT